MTKQTRFTNTCPKTPRARIVNVVVRRRANDKPKWPLPYGFSEAPAEPRQALVSVSPASRLHDPGWRLALGRHRLWVVLALPL